MYKPKMNAIKPLDAPLTEEQIRELSEKDEHGFITGVVHVELSDVIELDLEGFLDLLSERLVNSGCLSDISYKVVGHEDNQLFIEVRGDPALVLE